MAGPLLSVPHVVIFVAGAVTGAAGTKLMEGDVPLRQRYRNYKLYRAEERAEKARAKAEKYREGTHG